MSGRELWGRFALSALVAGMLLALAHPLTPTASVATVASAVVGAASGAATFALLSRRAPPLHRLRPPRLQPLVACVLVVWATCEEVVWRWFALGELNSRFGVVAALGASTVLFAASHPVSRRVHVLTGAVFGGVYVGTGSLVAAVLAHSTYNICAAAARPRASPAAEETA